MKILILYFELSIADMLGHILELAGYTVMRTPSASEAIRAIEESSDSCLLFTDNFHANPEGREALASLRNSQEARQRVWVVNLAVMSDPAWIAGGLIDEHLPLPFTPDRMLAIVAARARHPSQ